MKTYQHTNTLHTISENCIRIAALQNSKDENKHKLIAILLDHNEQLELSLRTFDEIGKIDDTVIEICAERLNNR